MLRAFFRLILYISLFLAMAAVAAVVTNHLLISSHDTVVVPDMEGKDLVSAMRILTGLGLDAKLTGMENSQTVPRNQVLLQDPAPGKSVKKGRSVLLTLSAGPRSLLMPDLSGTDVRAAKIRVEESGLPEPRVSWIYTANTPRDQVISQMPLAGQKTTVDEQPALLISLGPSPAGIKMPDLAGLSPDTAAMELERAGLAAGTVRTVSEPTQPEDTILEQKPPAGFRVYKGALVELAVNRPAPETASAGQYAAPQTIVRLTLPAALLKSRIKLHVSGLEPVTTIFSDYIEPGTTVWLIVPRKAKGFRLEKDGKPVFPTAYKSRFEVGSETAELLGY
ncbi:MAG: PASTA domain-containing protein [Thermodesulfobacteriota bacterium]